MSLAQALTWCDEGPGALSSKINPDSNNWSIVLSSGETPWSGEVTASASSTIIEHPPKFSKSRQLPLP